MSSSFDIPANGITKLKFSAVFKSLNNSVLMIMPKYISLKYRTFGQASLIFQTAIHLD